MKVGLNVFERFTLLGVLPQEGSFVHLRMQRKLVDKIGFADDELVELGIKQENDRVTWNPKGNESKEIDFGEKETEMIVKSLRKLDQEEKLSTRHITLYEKFVEEKTDANH